MKIIYWEALAANDPRYPSSGCWINLSALETEVILDPVTHDAAIRAEKE